ncbi:N-acetylneuraminate synthase [Xylanibacillus composti]|uniref:N-acetylneuraminate synthase n=1 Tax=Xylanibacillus composti TaxID=1572762 RepID=A0A8J4H5D5_9BACL|nr:N-acetylneuraminate synthase [Xylanibacillus composti]GIQ69986.1 N-acetylneuraminate synthase [Xylanibacillus composti]
MKRTYIIAEAGVNHNGSLALAKELIEAASDAGADAIKFQTFRADKIVTLNAAKAAYQLTNTSADESQYDMLKKLELSYEQHFELVHYAKERGIQFLSTPFDLESADFLIGKLKLPVMKISSGDLTNALLLLRISQGNIPVILSTGMATLGEIEEALGVLAFGYAVSNRMEPSIERFRQAYRSEKGQASLKQHVTLLHCTSEYPAPVNDVNLKAMLTLSHAFDLPVGYSDHTKGIAIPIAAAALGAQIIEKHFTLDKELPGPDHKASLDPAQLQEMIAAIRDVDQSLGGPLKLPAESELKNLEVSRKSLVTSKPVREGECFTSENLTVKRPGGGTQPMQYWRILGQKATRHYDADELVEL